MPTASELYEQFWAENWGKECEFPGASHLTRRRLFNKCLLPLVTRGATLLDVGCGNGLLVKDLAERFPELGRLAGTDVSEEALKLARKLLPKGTFFQADLQKEPFPEPESFDLVTSSEVLEHIDDYRAVLHQMVNAVKPGGALVISVPHSMRYWGPIDEAVHHLRRFEAAGLREDLEHEGLRVEQLFTWGAVVYQFYYQFFLNNISPEVAWKQKSFPVRMIHKILYYSFFLDDLFTSSLRGRMLFAVARKPS